MYKDAMAYRVGGGGGGEVAAGPEPLPRENGHQPFPHTV